MQQHLQLLQELLELLAELDVLLDLEREVAQVRSDSVDSAAADREMATQMTKIVGGGGCQLRFSRRPL